VRVAASVASWVLSDGYIDYPAGVMETPPTELHGSRKLISPGQEMRPALFRGEVAVIIVSGELFPVSWAGPVAVVTAAGEIDLTNAEGLRDALLTALNAGAQGLVVDMTATTFLDSAGVAAVVRASRRASASDATLRLAVTAAAVLRVLNLVGIDRLIEVHPSVNDALASLPGQVTVIDSSTRTPSGPAATET
jgi:anti-sigma B factor antagonist